MSQVHWSPLCVLGLATLRRGLGEGAGTDGQTPFLCTRGSPHGEARTAKVQAFSGESLGIRKPAGGRGSCTSTQRRGNQEAEQRSTWPPPPGGRMQDRTMRGRGGQGPGQGHLCLPGSPPWGLRKGSQVWGQRHHNSSISVSAGTLILSFSGY